MIDIKSYDINFIMRTKENIILNPFIKEDIKVYMMDLFPFRPKDSLSLSRQILLPTFTFVTFIFYYKRGFNILQPFVP